MACRTSSSLFSSRNESTHIPAARPAAGKRISGERPPARPTSLPADGPLPSSRGRAFFSVFSFSETPRNDSSSFFCSVISMATTPIWATWPLRSQWVHSVQSSGQAQSGSGNTALTSRFSTACPVAATLARCGSMSSTKSPRISRTLFPRCSCTATPFISAIAWLIAT